MANPMSPSNDPITPGQIAKFFDLLSAALRKSGLPSEPTQQILENQGKALAEEFVVAVRRRVEAISDMIVRHVVVDPTRSPQQALDATGRKQYTNTAVVKSMPKAGHDEADVCFFPVKRWISDDDLVLEFETRGLKPVDPFTLAQANADDPAFADDHPNATHWKDASGNWCCATFYRCSGERGVRVYRDNCDWNDRWWFAGVRK